MKKITFIILLLSSIISSFSSFSSVTFKGGIISSGEILKTEKPQKREHLFYDLKKLNLSHLDQTMSIADAIRFENRIGIGAPYKRVKRYIGKTRKEAIRLVVKELESYQDKFKWPNWSKNYIPTQFINDGLERSKINCQERLFRVHLEYLWSRSMLTNAVPQFEKLALFWLDHFSVAFDEYDQTHSFLRHLQFVRKNSTGNFEQFLRNSIKDPGIIVFLNNEQSTTQKPNENLAREFLELFSLGEGNYSENEIKNFAKKLPSHAINHVSQEFQLYKYKSSGQTLSAFGEKFSSADEFIDLVIDHPAFGEFIARKFYYEYVSLNEPSSEELAILVSSFRHNNFDIIKLFETTISLESFWNNDNRLTLVKSPIELVFGTARTLGIKSWENKRNISWLVSLTKEFGQDLFNPPNIAGWPVGKEWLSGQFLEKRMSLLPKHFSEEKLFKIPENNINKNNFQSTEYLIQDVDISSNIHSKWLTVRLAFNGIIKTENSKEKEYFVIGLDANLNKGKFHAIRLGGQSFEIPKKLSDSNQPGKFYISEYSVKSGAFGKLYDYLPIEKKVKLKSACQYLNNNENVQKILESIKDNDTTVKLLSSSLAKIHDFYEINGLASLHDDIKSLANTCDNFEEVELAQTSQSTDNSGNLMVSNKYNNELKSFYNETVKDQLAVETIAINWIPDDFETQGWASFEVGFYGVKFNGKFWDGMTIRFGTDINSKQKQEWKKLNRIEFSHGSSHPDIFSSWEGSWVSNWDGHYGWDSSFPRGPRMKNFNAKSRDEKLLMIRLLQAMEHILEKKDSYPQLMKNFYVQNWLKDRIEETDTKQWNLKDNSIPNTKIFSYTYHPKSKGENSKYRKFQCGAKRAGINFKEIRSINEKMSTSLPSKFLDAVDINLENLLLPDIDLGLDEKDFLSIVSYEGYQLK